MRTKIVTQDDTSDIVTIDEAMEHSRITDSYDEVVVQSTLEAAVDIVQQWLNRRLTRTSFKGQVEEYRSSITLPYPPVHSVSNITAKTKANETIELVEGSDWEYDGISERIRFIGSESFLSSLKQFEFDFEAGYPTDGVPKAVKHGILMTFATLYENREDVVVGTSVMEVPLKARRVIATHRIGSQG